MNDALPVWCKRDPVVELLLAENILLLNKFKMEQKSVVSLIFLIREKHT